MNRRRFLQWGGLATFGSGYPADGGTQTPGHDHGRFDNVQPFRPAPPPELQNRPFVTPLRLPGATGLFGLIDLNRPLRITAKIIRQVLFAGKATDLWTYETPVDGKPVWNPLLRVRRNDIVDVTLHNALGEDTTIHWHGFHVDEKNDGSGMHPVKHLDDYVYRYKVINRPGLYWYHPHPHDRTGAQVHQGMGSLLLVEDNADVALRKELGLTFGQTEIPLVIQDKQVDIFNKLKYSMGEDDWIGNRVLVNWTPEPYLDVATCLYRFRILNGSNARIYRLAFAHGKSLLPFHLIGTDGGLLSRPQLVTELFVAPAQRVDILIDFEKVPFGSRVMMTSLQYDAMENDGSAIDPMMEHPGARPMGEAVDIMQINVKEPLCAPRKLPAQFSAALPFPDIRNAVMRPFRLHLNGTQLLINGSNYHQDMHKISFVVKAGQAEVWEIPNDMISMPHPMHVHGYHFRVLERRNSPGQMKRLVVTKSGITPHDLGWLDTVLVWPGETVRVAVDFAPALPGNNLYMFHCHNLEHEDQGLMLNFRVDS